MCPSYSQPAAPLLRSSICRHRTVPLRNGWSWLRIASIHTTGSNPSHSAARGGRKCPPSWIQARALVLVGSRLLFGRRTQMGASNVSQTTACITIVVAAIAETTTTTTTTHAARTDWNSHANRRQREREKKEHQDPFIGVEHERFRCLGALDHADLDVLKISLSSLVSRRRGCKHC